MKRKYMSNLLFALSVLLLLTGCSGGINGEGTNDYSQSAGTPVVRGNAFNDQGWVFIATGQYESAIVKFNAVLADNPTPAEEAEANNGLGWAWSRLGALADGMPWFMKAVSLSDDAKVGLAAGYVQKGSRADLEMAIDILYKDLGGENPHFHYLSRRDTGVSDAEAHAMLAYCFAAVGRNDDALEQIDFAKELNPSYANTTVDQLGKIVEFLLK